MSDTIWKYVLQHGGVAEHSIPFNAKFLHVGTDPATGTPALWFRVDPENHKVKRAFSFIGTGHPIPQGKSYYRGTCNSGPFMWHVFEIFTPDPEVTA